MISIILLLFLVASMETLHFSTKARPQSHTDFFTFTLTEHSGHIIYYAQGVKNLETESETNELTTDTASFFPLMHLSMSCPTYPKSG